ncbi:MAG TPA: glycosyltransferase [Vicinamibacterales bacterium]|nr:glycosyltransferase [Vicinamibacterales bacterium]
MRVLHVAAYYAPAYVYGGPPRSIHGLCRALTRHGVDVEVFTTDANGEAALPPTVTGSGDFEGVPVRYFPRTWPLEPIGSRALATTLRRTIGRFDALHIHGLWNRIVWTAAREARRAGVPYVLSPRGMLETAALAHKPWRKRLAYAAIERHTIEGAATCHATSAREAATLRAITPDASVVLIPNGVDVPAGADPAPNVRPTFVFIGRLHAIKRLDLLLDAFAQVVAVRPDARLIIAGPDEQRLRELLEPRQAPGNRVTWLGAVDARQRDAVLAQARALVVCSDSESFGMAVVEAMAAGRAVIVTRTCGWDDLERRGAGLLVDQNPLAIADAMQRLLDAPAAASTMGVNGRRWVEEAFTWDAVARRFIETYSAIGHALAT